jgi:type IV pilus assembly protein PilQ
MKTKIQIVILALATGGLAAYAQDDNANPPAAAPPAEVAQATPAPASAPPPAPAPAPAAPAAAAPANPNEAVPLIVIDDVPLTDAIRNLARQSNLNFQFDPRVTASNQPNISIRFENVSPQEALTAVLDNYGLKLDKDARFKVLRVTIKEPKAEEPLVTKIVQLKYCEATNMVAMLKPTIDKRSQVLADPRTGQIILSTTEKDMDGALATIEKLDTPTKQVLIEGTFVETTKNPKTIKGIDWSGTLQAQNVSIGNQGPVLGTPGVIASIGGKFLPPVAYLNADGVNAVMSFLNRDTETELIATPRTVTLDNQVAHIEVTRAFPIFQVTPGSASVAAGSQVTYTNLGVILHVTPRIAADNNISLKIKPEVSARGPKDVQTLDGRDYSANTFDVRRIETQVMVPSGNTLVMGGLVHDSVNNAFTKVPILGDIPGLGFFFRHSDKAREKRNLLIFITPTVVEDDSFQVTSSGPDFLRTKQVQKVDGELSAWDSAKPHDWTKPVY